MNINKVYYLILIFGFAFQTSFTQNNYDVVKSDKEWRSQLNELSYLVLRKAYTERPYTGKYDDFYEINENEMPSDIQLLINNDDMGVAMLRIVESIGQDELKDMDPDTIYFIISTLNQLDIDPLRNKILLKVLPLKVKKYN